MNQNGKIAIIGGTGKSGKYLVKELLEQGIRFKMLMRNQGNFQIENPLIEIVKGDARDYSTICVLLEGCTGVISTLGQPKGEPTIFSQATKNVIRAMKELKVNRYILTTGLNVDTPDDKKGVKSNFATEWMKTNYPETTNDKQVEFTILSESIVDWTLVRLPLIELTDKKSKIQVSLEDCPGEKISATNLADFLVGQLQDTAYLRKAPFIANV